MAWTKHDYENIPGTYVFDGKHAHGAYPLNKLLFSFCEEANRAEFDADPAAYCDKYGVTGKYKEVRGQHLLHGQDGNPAQHLGAGRRCAVPGHHDQGIPGQAAGEGGWTGGKDQGTRGLLEWLGSLVV
jgi:Aromatic-ring-opening dioxygenase LigAB, LigA subunit